jgi:catechol 2,3-dioxygenase-like lactoylglutathione lyase family enzyme
MPRINHIALKVTDLEAATRFYENARTHLASSDRWLYRSRADDL